jgi:hypothetical protein
LADKALHAPVPPALVDYLVAHHKTLVPEVRNLWEAKGSPTTGAWEDIFGIGAATDELFMAWYYGVYIEGIAKAAKSVYDIPLYLNAALNAPGRKPGEYPSGGPLPHVFDIWKAAAPSTTRCSSPNIDLKPVPTSRPSTPSATVMPSASRRFR